MYFKREDANVYNLYRTLITEETEWDGKQLSTEDLIKAKHKLILSRMALQEGWQFFGHLLSGLSTCLTYDMDTMAVDDFGNIYINPYFMLNVLSDEETVGVLAHEVLHIANLTHFRGANVKNFKLWNIATDYIMNRDLIKMGLSLPAFGCVPESRGKIDVIPSKKEIPKYWHGIDMTTMDAEDLYKALDKAIPPQVKQQQQQMQQLQDMINKMMEKMDKHITGGQPGQPGSGQPTVIDVSNLPGEKYKDSNLTPNKPNGTDRKQIETEMKNKIKIAVEALERGAKGAENIKGGVPASFNKKHLEPAVNWKIHLAQFLSPARRNTYDSARFQKKPLTIGVPMARRKTRSQKVDLAVAIDTSGSTTGDVLATFLGAIYGIIKTFPIAELRIILWHSEVYNEIEIVKADQKVIIGVRDPGTLGDNPNVNQINGTALNPTANSELNSDGEVITNISNAKEILLNVYSRYTKSGGTTVNSIKEYLDKNGEKIEGLLLLTDGDTTENQRSIKLPTPPNKTVIMINGNGKDDNLKGHGKILFVDVPEVETP
jgi:predicted metal-dependent peptidase